MARAAITSTENVMQATRSCAQTSPIIVAAAKARGLVLPVPSDVAETPGEGVVGSVDGHDVIVGGDDFVAQCLGRVAVVHPALEAGSVIVAVAVDGDKGRASGFVILVELLAKQEAATMGTGMTGCGNGVSIDAG